ncbi:ComC/BlpC family leader-containing pheromone/bacteriocin [Proteiniphilum sp. UBA5384]|uniref:ComC/BlpC family leader-containing pheromone/bacteriocin n=1 Tax=Proteiniphilum sp. UBA5384 TaxID=1947279 RepID=UPI0025EA4F12|nr:ComC/BlpC family leader-containing pheromone/bacteriocin [Proteiniphilum sp. UBA5384]
MKSIQKTNNFEILDQAAMQSIKGGNSGSKDEGRIVYIGGIPYRVTKNGLEPL